MWDSLKGNKCLSILKNRLMDTNANACMQSCTYTCKPQHTHTL